MKNSQNNILNQPLVLIVTDATVDWELQSRFLQKHNYRTVQAETKSDLLDVFRNQQPNCVYLDIPSSQDNIFQICHQIKKSENTLHIPMMIGISGEEDTVIDLCFEMGADDFITRPMDLTPGFLKILSKRIELLLKRKQAEEKIARQQKLLETLINTIPDMICLKDGDGRWLLANDFDLEFFQLQDVKYKGKTDLDLAAASTFYHNTFLTCMNTDKEAWQKGEATRGEEIILRADNSLRVFDLVKIPLYNTDGSRHALVITGRDITDRINAEQEREASARKLRQAQKMEAIGLMAGGVAHDLNNILSALVSYPELLLLKLPQDSEVRPFIEAMQKSGQQATEVVADLLTVARGATEVRITANLNTLINDYLESIEFRETKRHYKKISYSIDLDPELLHISCSPVHIKKCLMNLIMNSAEAIKDTGTISISTRNQYIELALEDHPNMDPGKYVVLSITDSGEGILQKDLEHIFEPFYSKKVMHRSGTGLGLTVVWNTIQDHGGGITATSNDENTTFELYFPVTTEQIYRKMTNISIADIRGKGQTVLVVDDTKLQRDIADKVLTALGYKSILVESGEKAIAFLKENKVDLVILDMIMEPGMSGRETYEHIITLHPGQKALIVSGFSESEEVKKAKELGVIEFIKKPYSLTHIGIAIKNALCEK